jgi:hypothetical protein
LIELGLCPKIDPMRPSSNSEEYVAIDKLLGLRTRLRNLESQQKHESMLIRTRAKLVIKIRTKISSNHHRHFIEHLVDIFKKAPRENN